MLYPGLIQLRVVLLLLLVARAQVSKNTNFVNYCPFICCSLTARILNTGIFRYISLFNGGAFPAPEVLRKLAERRGGKRGISSISLFPLYLNRPRYDSTFRTDIKLLELIIFIPGRRILRCSLTNRGYTLIAGQFSLLFSKRRPMIDQTVFPKS